MPNVTYVPAVVNFTFRNGDTMSWGPEFTTGFLLGVTRIVQEWRDANDVAVFRADSDEETIAIEGDFAKWQHVPIDVTPGNYDHDVQFWFSDGAAPTLFVGKVTIKKDNARP